MNPYDLREDSPLFFVFIDDYLERFHPRWSKIKGVYDAFPMSITLFSNHFK